MRHKQHQQRKYQIIKKLKKSLSHKYKIINIFDYNDLFTYILKFADEKDKIELACANIKIRKLVLNSKLCPVYYKFNATFFVNNISNQEVLDIYKRYSDIFKKILTAQFLKTYCSCCSYGCCCFQFHKDEKKCFACCINGFYPFRRCCQRVLFSSSVLARFTATFKKPVAKYIFPTKPSKSHPLSLQPEYELNRNSRPIGAAAIKNRMKYKQNNR
ncbi:MAG: hypothetical protein Hyperionvirus32_8 [Hyperionvirus sp.]|uniref:Uncharacterized protein n=1 Tax=Hyperionvirus sp. TaxID=2487770 RepID=A0A3G5AEE4_9VIRU|nr:MAG: hypothetical protein Hyperionvirus32_8 [Hyperionvirus sp.]